MDLTLISPDVLHTLQVLDGVSGEPSLARGGTKAWRLFNNLSGEIKRTNRKLMKGEDGNLADDQKVQKHLTILRICQQSQQAN
ncbi:hypothetical protein RRG08_018236 [Elysia crispata]|uniref:Uncharacterized protein n=1 Tax=Elysia crispata TaxID=231223 RepID=A0AAE0YK58_9GAST|nr:hypothetical protein RRG08_018236 [Elysia crispata]